ncbi:ABC transporter permease [Nakamurella flava]|uniref:ABC transporter permease n=1 Tax=Nakamurella flava TaxID=2576308 RepID=A0A4U6QFM8_9ACTN|nr:ABC transporter permease [Nakamurella flava]TKV58826.1 ABC transporter permease [Nakamurella flava]
MTGSRARRILLGAAAPVAALLVSVLITSILLVVTGHSPAEAFGAMAGAFERLRNVLGTINQTAIYYLAAVAVAIGFKMNLFNIGVDGQYRLAAMLSAAVAGASFMSSLPSFLRILITLAVAMAVGAAWAGIAAFLKVTRGVSEVISTIMLNAIATFLIAWLLTPQLLAVLEGNNIATPKITEGGQVGVIAFEGSTTPLFTLVFLALGVGALYALVLSRTVFGFSLRATGLSESAAVASGISVKKMIVAAMLLSGAVAGLVGMPELLNGSAGSYSLNFPAGIGFTGIAIALLGRNHPVGMIFSALLWSALDNSANALQGVGVPRELVTIMQGVIVLSVVVAYEFVRRYRLNLEARDVARALANRPKQEVAA